MNWSRTRIMKTYGLESRKTLKTSNFEVVKEHPHRRKTQNKTKQDAA